MSCPCKKATYTMHKELFRLSFSEMIPGETVFSEEQALAMILLMEEETPRCKE